MFGRRQEVVFIGQHMKASVISAALDTCLVTPEELSAGGAAMKDPLFGVNTDEEERAEAEALACLVEKA